MSRPLGAAVEELMVLAPEDREARALLSRYNAWYNAMPTDPSMDDGKFKAGWDLCNEVEDLITTIKEESTMTEQITRDHEELVTEDRTGKSSAVVAGEYTGKVLRAGKVGTILASRGIATGGRATAQFARDNYPKVRKGLRDYLRTVRDEYRK